MTNEQFLHIWNEARLKALKDIEDRKAPSIQQFILYVDTKILGSLSGLEDPKEN